MRTTLTAAGINAAIRKANGERVEINDPEASGLNLRIGRRGQAIWTWLGRDATGRVRRFQLGQYPRVGLAEARTLARDMSYDVRRNGVDPVTKARAHQVAPESTKPQQTFGTLLDLYDRQIGAQAKSWPAMRRQIERVFGPLLPLPLAELTVGKVQLAADNYPAQRSAGHAAGCLRPLLRWASAPGRAYMSADLLGLRSPAKPQRRDRVLSRDELAKLLPVMRASTGGVYATALLLIALTLVRREEAAAARWRDIDFVTATWTLPSTKNGLMHLVPLSRQALDLLRTHRPAHADRDALVFITSTGRPLSSWSKATAKLQIASGTSDWTRHDLRRTGATLLGEMGTIPDIVEAALNHASIRSPLAATYNRSRYRPQVRAALQMLADFYDGIETGGAVVIPMPARQ